MSASHDMPSHAEAKRLISLADMALRAQVENLPPQEGSPSFCKTGPASACLPHLAACRAQGNATGAGGAGFPRSGGAPPLQGQAFSHRSLFLHLPKACHHEGPRVRTAASPWGTGLGYGGCAV